MLRNALVAGLVLFAVPARADDDDDVKQAFARLSILMGNRSIGTSDSGLDAFALGIGRAGRTWSLYGELESGYLHESGQHPALSTTLSAHRRPNIRRASWDHGELGASCWIDGGLGVQDTRWEGGALHRPMTSLELGSDFDFRVDHRRYWLGIGLRLEAAPGVETGASTSARCSSCAMTFDRYDFGASLRASFAFTL